MAVRKMKQRSAVPADTELGKRLRLRRVEMNISQAELGDAIGVSFQQVQKYEKGVNRISANRIIQIAKHLDVPTTFFFDVDTKQVEVESLLFTDSNFSLRMLRAYTAINNEVVQRSIVTMMERLAEEWPKKK